MRNNFFEKNRIKILENEQKLYQCGVCLEFKPIELFNKNKLKKDGIDYRCKACDKKYRLKNIKHVLHRNRLYRLKNKEIIKQKDKEYSKTLRGILSLKIRSKKYKQKHANKIRFFQNEYRKQRRKTNPHYKIRDNLRVRLIEILTAKNIKKVISSAKLIGCSGEELKKHIEFQFYQGISWETLYKNFVIDHFFSCHCFDFNNQDDIKECWNYKNLRPLNKQENTKKSFYDKRIGDFLKKILDQKERRVFRHIIHQNHLKTLNFGQTYTHLNTLNPTTCKNMRLQDTICN